MDLAQRSQDHEVMDDDDISLADYNQALHDLAAVNRITQTHAPTLHWLGEATRSLKPGASLSILDVACGEGDLLRAIRAWSSQRGFDTVLQGIDLNPRSAVAARAATPQDSRITFLTGNVFDYRPAPRPDFIVSSQFTHHLSDDEVVRFLTWHEASSTRGWFISDLHRHVIPYLGFRLLCRLAGWHRIVRLDGTVSIARSFKTADWTRYLGAAGLSANINWRFPFRLCVGRLK